MTTPELDVEIVERVEKWLKEWPHWKCTDTVVEGIKQVIAAERARADAAEKERAHWRHCAEASDNTAAEFEGKAYDLERQLEQTQSTLAETKAALERAREALRRLIDHHGDYINDLPGETGVSDLAFARAALTTGGE